MTKRAILTATCLIALLPFSATAEPKAGAYLAARQAAKDSAFSTSAAYFRESLEADPLNPYLLENAMISHMGLGDFAAAKPFASMMVDADFKSQMAHLVLSVSAANEDDWDTVTTNLDAEQDIGPLVDGLTRAWALVGKGQMTDAITAFDEVIASPGLGAYGLYNKALAIAYVGDFEGADAIFAGSPQNGLRYTRRSAIAQAQILSQLDRNADAITLLDTIFGTQTDATLAQIRNDLSQEQLVPFTYVRGAKDGMSEIYLTLAQALVGDADDGYTLLYARASAFLNPNNSDAILLAAKLLDNMGQHELSAATFSSVVSEDPAFLAAELGRADTLRKAGKIDVAIEVLEALASKHPDMPRVFATAGDTYRENDELDKAKTAYSRALYLYDDADPLKWFIYYARGITNHLLDDWPAAEADFRAALKLNKDQPQVLNYLGYSMVERNVNMEEALQMIETAVAAEPQNGAIVDSLGWVLYQRGEYEDAVVHLENSASLLPVDPIINDHLGDGLWAVGRFVEARFQWNRALSFDPTEEDAIRIRRKLEIGLDAVLEQDGEPPLRAKNGDN